MPTNPRKKRISQKKTGSDELFFAGLQKNKDNMRLLISYPEFQKDIAEARQRLDIPADGFPPEGGNEDVKEWMDHLYNKTDEMMDHPDFLLPLREIGRKFEQKELSRRAADKESKLLHLMLPINYFTHIPKFLCDKYHVPKNYSDYVQRYMIFGIVNAPPNNFTLGPWTDGSLLPWESTYVPINIYSRLTDEEWRDLRREVERMGKKLPSFQPLKNIETKITIEQWFNDREKTDLVEMTTYKMRAAEIAKELLGDEKDAPKVYEAVREVRELRKKRFGKREG